MSYGYLLIHSMVQDILWKADSQSASQTIDFFLCGIFVIVLTKARHWTLSWSSRIQFESSIVISVRSNLNVILSPTPRSFQWSFPLWPLNQNPVNTSPLPYACHMSRPPHPPWFDHPNNIRWRIQAVKFIIMQFPPDLSSSLLGPNVLLNILFSKNP
jgi:hypothetical protein